MGKLYEIAQSYQTFLENLDEIPEEAIADTLEAIEGEFDVKADAVACVIKELLADSAALKAEEDALNERRKSKQNRAERLKKYLYDQMEAIGRKKIETPRCVLTLRKNPPSTQIANADEFILWAQSKGRDDLLTFKNPEPNKTAIKTALNSGEIIPGASIEQKEGLTIK